MSIDVEDPPFKLSSDETMRGLRAIAQAPGELQWRMELVAALERMRVTQEVSTRNILMDNQRLRKELAHLAPAKLQATIDKRIDESKAQQESNRYKKFLHHIITAAVSIIVAYAVYRLTGH